MAGCGSPTAYLPDQSLDGTVAYDDPRTEWTAHTPTAHPIDERLQPGTVFDTWRVEAPEFRDHTWDALFHVLTAVNIAIDDRDASLALEWLMIRLDPQAEDTEWELAFVSEQQGRAEGVVWRIATEDSAGLSIEAVRSAEGGDSPTRWTLRAEPAVAENDGLAVRFDQADETTRARITPAAGAERIDERLDTAGGWEESVALLTDALWEPVTGPDYAEPDFEYDDSADDDLADGWPAALGVDVQPRELEDFVVDTVFPPQGRGDELEHF